MPNPYYTNMASAPFEVAWALGASYGSSIKVGPPPKEFATAKMSGEKFYSMKWNGEVRLTDQVLIQYSDNSYDMNRNGEQLKLFANTVHGYLPGERRFGFPIIFKRRRAPLLLA